MAYANRPVAVPWPRFVSCHLYSVELKDGAWSALASRRIEHSGHAFLSGKSASAQWKCVRGRFASESSGWRREEGKVGVESRCRRDAPADRFYGSLCLASRAARDERSWRASKEQQSALGRLEAYSRGHHYEGDSIELVEVTAANDSSIICRVGGIYGCLQCHWEERWLGLWTVS